MSALIHFIQQSEKTGHSIITSAWILTPIPEFLYVKMQNTHKSLPHILLIEA